MSAQAVQQSTIAKILSKVLAAYGALLLLFALIQIYSFVRAQSLFPANPQGGSSRVFVWHALLFARPIALLFASVLLHRRKMLVLWPCYIVVGVEWAAPIYRFVAMRTSMPPLQLWQWLSYLQFEIEHRFFSALLLTVGIVSVHVAIRRSTQSAIQPACQSCGYSMRGLQTPVCPECGRIYTLDEYHALGQ